MPDTLHIDWTACDGRGLCAELLPELLTTDDWGYPHAAGPRPEVPPHLAGAARQAVRRCPAQALHLLR
jgi:ferredoxin